MPPAEWHAKLKEAKQQTNDKDAPLILDCRNEYETSVGKFIGSTPLNTTNFCPITFIESPDSIHDLYEKYQVLIAPHLYGAGIQYKVSLKETWLVLYNQ